MRRGASGAGQEVGRNALGIAPPAGRERPELNHGHAPARLDAPRRRFAMGMGRKQAQGEIGGKRGEDSAGQRVMRKNKNNKKKEKEIMKRNMKKKKRGRKRPTSRKGVQAAEDGLRKEGRQTAKGAGAFGRNHWARSRRKARNPGNSSPGPIGLVFWSSRSSGPSGRRYAEQKTQSKETMRRPRQFAVFFFGHSGSLLTSLSFL